MRKLFLLTAVFLSLAFYSCGKKQEEVRIHKVSEGRDTRTADPKESKDSTEKPGGSGETPKAYSSEEAKNHGGENAVVTGYVADVVKRERVAYLNFDRKYPKNTFTGVVFEEKFEEVGDLSIYRNKNIELKGKITLYKDKPQIIITSKNQIRILK
ncbi:MAG: hypothetical protein HY959_05610 [Ignavibacteriae bacterium]|nr:hypothetical protein [Ignavibacteriota bacterium]